MPGSRHNNFRKIMYICRFKMTGPQAQKLFVGSDGEALLAQLDACKDDEARRLLLGVSEKQEKIEK